jgi:hypothetical protein
VSRAERRHQRRRAIARMAQIVKYVWRVRAEWRDDLARKLADNPAPCSEPCCGNQRQRSGPPISEIRRARRAEEE